jgi:hypothetical protein
VHRCHRHKERNVTELLPERERPAILATSAARGRSPTPSSPKLRAARAAGLRAGAYPAGRRRLVARSDERDAAADAPRDHRAARQDAVLNEPVRVHDRDRPLHAAKREALAGRRHAQALDGRRDARRRASSDGSSATATSPSSRSSDTPSALPRTATTVRRPASPLRFDSQPARIVTEVPRRTG